MQANKIIVIHPGSRNLRIGRAADLNPVTILHAIARRRRVPEGNQNCTQPYRDTLLPVPQEAALPEFLEFYNHLKQNLTQAAGSSKSKRARAASPTNQIIAFNKQSEAEKVTLIKEEAPKAKVDFSAKDALFDTELLELDAQELAAFNVHFPMRRGELNTHTGIGGSLTAVLTDLEAIWRYALYNRLDIKESDLGKYAAVLLVPDIYNRSYLRELVTLLLQKLKFRSCFVLQDSVASTFGAGLGYACVVDLGDQKCSISCVDDGISQPDTRLRLPAGSADITSIFYTILQRQAFPYKQCNVEQCLADALLISAQKERFCQLSDETLGVQERSIEFKNKQGERYRYLFQFGVESIAAPLALFHTELLSLTCKQRQACIQLSSSQQPDAEDCFDADYIRDTSRRNGMRGDQLPGETGDDEMDDMDASSKHICEQKSDFAYTGSGQVLPLDQAIIRSIDRCATDDMKRKMLSCILLVGGGVKLTGFMKYLEQKIKLQLANSGLLQRLNDQSTVEVNVIMREMDAGMIAWKGAAIMSCLESAPELWISPKEWEKYGLRILREKAPFIW